jgi:hypothetical protein
MCGNLRKTSPKFRSLVITNLLCVAQIQYFVALAVTDKISDPNHRTDIPLGRNRAEPIIDMDVYLSVATASRAGLPTFLDRNGTATTLTVPVTQAHPISIMVTNSITVAPAFPDADAVGTHDHFGLGQCDKIVGNRDGACERR